MLQITRKAGESLTIGDDIIITFISGTNGIAEIEVICANDDSLIQETHLQDNN